MKADRFNSNRHVVYRMTRNHLPPRLSRNRIEFEFLWDKHRFMEDGGHGKQLWRRNSFSYTFAERNSRVEFSPPICVWSTAKPVETPNSQNLPRKQTGQTGTQHLDLRIHKNQSSGKAFIVFNHCIHPKKNIKRRCFQGIFSPQLSFTSFTHRFIMAPSYRPISSITESLTLENTGPLEATGPPLHDMSCFVFFFFVLGIRDTLNRARALFGWLVVVKCHWDFAAFWDPKFLQISIWQSALISHQRLDFVQGVGFATTNSKPGVSKLLHVGQKNIFCAGPLYCAGRVRVLPYVFSGIWQIQPVPLKRFFKGFFQRGWFLCNVGFFGFLWKGLGSHRLNSSAGYSLVFFLDKVKVAKFKTPFSSHECQANVSRSSIPSAQISKKVVYLLMERKRFWWISIRATRRKSARKIIPGKESAVQRQLFYFEVMLRSWCRFHQPWPKMTLFSLGSLICANYHLNFLSLLDAVWPGWQEEWNSEATCLDWRISFVVQQGGGECAP